MFNRIRASYLYGMKNHIVVVIIAALSLFQGCSTTTEDSTEKSFGQAIDTSSSITPEQAVSLLDSATAAACTVVGTVTEVCQAEGCWLKLGLADGSGLLVLMKEHSFNVPKSINGKSVFVGGTITRDTISVETLQQYAKEDGKTADEIAAITAPEIKPVLQPVGVVVR